MRHFLLLALLFLSCPLPAVARETSEQRRLAFLNPVLPDPEGGNRWFTLPSPLGGAALIGRLEPASATRTPSGREVPVYFAQSLQGVFPRAMAHSEFIILSKKEEENFEGLFPLWRRWWNQASLGQGPARPSGDSPEEAKRFLEMRILSHAFGRHNLPEAKRRLWESVLVEEGAHSDAMKFAHALSRDPRPLGLMLSSKEAIWTARQIVKPGIFSKDLESIHERPLKDQATEAWAVIEIEGWLLRLEQSPEPSFKFLEILQGGSSLPPQYARGGELLLPLLSEQLAGRRMDERQWLDFLLEATADMDGFNQRLRRAAKNLYAQEFLSASARSERLK
ncbi:MAG: hypothetical protein HY211_08090 [Candidatus Omnitrophica bacterium]|nr:hypothetical protein [Candidatus Omnitrophota bacterium]